MLATQIQLGKTMATKAHTQIETGKENNVISQLFILNCNYILFTFILNILLRAWLSDKEYMVLKRLSKRVSIITGLNTEFKDKLTDAEKFQVGLLYVFDFIFCFIFCIEHRITI